MRWPKSEECGEVNKHGDKSELFASKGWPQKEGGCTKKSRRNRREERTFELTDAGDSKKKCNWER